MKLKLHLYYNAFGSDFHNFKGLTIQAKTNDYDSEYEVVFKTVVVDIKDCSLTEKEYKDAYYLKKLSAAELEVEKKRKELHLAEETVKNMMAISHDPQ